ncbi:unnamed protein product [Lactuca saligna]|uniref:Uncharacterized protein n=1 Tax=Lactuca saligna TaxID=75948 RepID=A0AA35VLE0_LACSI|nr:unnamed protein product [Lactuca saligna]
MQIDIKISKDPPYILWCFEDYVVRVSLTLYFDVYPVVSLVESDYYQLGVHNISRVGFLGLSEAPSLRRMNWLPFCNCHLYCGLIKFYGLMFHFRLHLLGDIIYQPHVCIPDANFFSQ